MKTQPLQRVLTDSKQPRTPAARTGREALDRRRSRLSKDQKYQV